MKKILLIIIVLSLFLFGCNEQASSPLPNDYIENIDDKLDIIVDSATSYLRYDKALYEKAINDDKVVLLDFYASWCPICRNEHPKLVEAFKELNDSNVVAFQVHYNDNEVTEDEKELAEKYGVTYQHTKVILKNSEVALKSLEAWDKEKTLSELRKVADG